MPAPICSNPEIERVPGNDLFILTANPAAAIANQDTAVEPVVVTEVQLQGVVEAQVRGAVMLPGELGEAGKV
jgi:hypothetical protein